MRLAIDFYSHAPRGARLQDQEAAGRREEFLLTRPSRGATILTAKLLPMLTISTHTPLAGRDVSVGRSRVYPDHFYSHAPRGARLGLYRHCRQQ